MRRFFLATGIVIHRDHKGLGLLIAEIVGQMFVLIRFAALEREAFSRAREDISLQLGAFAGEQIGNIHAENPGNVEQVAEGKIARTRFIGNVFL